MKRFFLMITCLSALLISTNLEAQKINIGGNAGVAFPLGDNADVFKPGIGFDGSVDYYFNEVFDIGLESGLRSFRYEGSDGELKVVPVQLTFGLHSDINDFVDLYGELGGGRYFFNPETGTSEAYNGLSPTVGIAVELGERWFLDTNLDYTHVFTEGNDMRWFGLNFGLLYSIKTSY